MLAQRRILLRGVSEIESTESFMLRSNLDFGDIYSSGSTHDVELHLSYDILCTL